jgi:glycosyltransferase involved in cell wall biosynthesis
MVAKVSAPPRTALVADYLDEGWPSMDSTAEMLLAHLLNAVVQGEMEFELLRPNFKARFGRLPLLNRRATHNADRFLNRFLDYPRFLRKERGAFDLFHLVDHSYSQLVHELPANRTVVTCHDLDTFRCLWEPGRAGRGLAFIAMTRRILSGFKKAAHVCCDSAATRDEILARKLLPPEKTSVVPLGVDSPFFQSPGAETSASVAAMLKDDFSTSPIYLLHVGSVIPRKRIDLLLETFARLHRTNPRLRLLRVGGSLTAVQKSQAERAGIRDAIRVLPFLSTEQLAAVYQRAALLLLPSDAEGFGFPVIEAMASGTAVLASDLPVLGEVGGDVASYAPPGDITAWVAKATEILEKEQNQSLDRKTRREGRRNQAAKFTWQKTAGALASVYRELLQRSK